MKSMSKSQLADQAGVSLSTLGRWLRCHFDELSKFGVTRNAHLLNPAAVRFVCDNYGIDL